jgi:hypothetical protein
MRDRRQSGKQWHIGWSDTYYAFLRESPQDEDKLLIIYNNAPKTVALTTPSKTRLSKLRTSYRQCLGTRPRSLRPATCTLYCRLRHSPSSACVSEITPDGSR